MTKLEKYLDTLKRSGSNWLTVREWALKFGELYPNDMREHDEQVKYQRDVLHTTGYKVNQTGLDATCGRISSLISGNHFDRYIEKNDDEVNMRFRLKQDMDISDCEAIEVAKDIETYELDLNRRLKIKEDTLKLTAYEIYRMQELESISKNFRNLNLDVECDHAKALCNPDDPGVHHPNNFQILLKSHNREKKNSNWQRFDLAAQLEYIKTAAHIQRITSRKSGIAFDEGTFAALLKRLELIY